MYVMFWIDQEIDIMDPSIVLSFFHIHFIVDYLSITKLVEPFYLFLLSIVKGNKRALQVWVEPHLLSP